MTTWAREEMETADLGDRRLDERLATLLGQLGDHPQLSIPAACGGWAETVAAYRFFDNPKSGFDAVLKPHRDATVARMATRQVVLVPQDTTEDDKVVCLGPKGLGTIKEVRKHPRRLHLSVAFTPQRVCLGVLRAVHWARDEPCPRAERRHRGVDEKESRHWVDGYQDCCALQGQLPGTQVVSLADREGDIYEWFAEYEDHAPCTRAQWIVRAAQDRRLRPDGDDGTAKLWGALARAPVLGHVEVEVKPRPKRAGRLAHVALRSATVRLRPPSRVGYHLPEMAVNAVLAREESPPPGEQALEWLLLTGLPVASYQQASLVVAWYAVRWCIEVYFHVLKSGCQLKRLHLETDARLLPCLALYMVVAWRVLFALMLGRGCPDASCEIVFDPKEWKAAYAVVKRCQPPAVPPPLGEVVALVASLGGYLGRKHDGPPGPKAMWIGLQRLRDFVIAIDALQSLGERCV